MSTASDFTFAAYSFKTGQALNAAQATSAGRVRDAQNRYRRYNVGDYIVQNPDGKLTVRKKVEFESEMQSATGPSAAPNTLAQTNNATTALRATWTNGDAGAKTEVWVNGVKVATVNATIALYDLTGLTADTAYAVKVRHILNEVTSAFVTATLYTIPVAPATPTLASKAATTIDVNFVPVGTATLTQVLVGGVNNGAAIAHATATKHITGLTTATLYSITVKAVGAVSGLSSAASAALAVTTD